MHSPGNRQCLIRVRAGIIDDIYGAGFVHGSTNGNVQDQHGHGTFVAGIVGGVGKLGSGVMGLNQVWSCATIEDF